MKKMSGLCKKKSDSLLFNDGYISWEKKYLPRFSAKEEKESFWSRENDGTWLW